MSGGGFESIEFFEEKHDQLRKEKTGNDRTYYITNLSKTINSCANAASERDAKLYASFSFGDIPSRQFDVIRERVDDLLLDIYSGPGTKLRPRARHRIPPANVAKRTAPNNARGSGWKKRPHSKEPSPCSNHLTWA
jgi:hypothetical protein